MKAEPHEREITRTVNTGFGKTEIVAWYEYGNGDRYQRISGRFELDGKTWPPGTFLMLRQGARYAVAMSPEAWQADRERRT